MTKRSSILVLSALALLPQYAHAHFVWAAYDPVLKTVKLEIAESPGISVAPLLGQLKNAIVTTGLGDLVEASDHRSMRAALTKGGPAAVTLTYGLHGDDLVTWWAKAGVGLGDASRSLHQTYEMTMRRSGKDVIATLLFNGRAVPGISVEAYGGGLAKDLQLKTDLHGQVRVGGVQKGSLALGAIVTVPGSGVYKGKAYKDVLNLVSVTANID